VSVVCFARGDICTYRVAYDDRRRVAFSVVVVFLYGFKNRIIQNATPKRVCVRRYLCRGNALAGAGLRMCGRHTCVQHTTLDYIRVSYGSNNRSIFLQHEEMFEGGGQFVHGTTRFRVAFSEWTIWRRRAYTKQTTRLRRATTTNKENDERSRVVTVLTTIDNDCTDMSGSP